MRYRRVRSDTGSLRDQRLPACLPKGTKTPLRRNVTIDEVGNATAFLCSTASGITGDVLYVDSGTTFWAWHRRAVLEVTPSLKKAAARPLFVNLLCASTSIP